MTAETHLQQYGITIAQAKKFILDNVNKPSNIYSVAKQFGVTNDMLAEIVGGVTAGDVKGWFAVRGFDASLLEGGAATGTQLIQTSMSNLTAKLQSMNMLTFSDKVLSAWRDAGADFDMDGKVERSAESLGGKSVTEVGLTYLLNVGVRLTQDDVAKMQSAMAIDPAKLMANPASAQHLWDNLMSLYNGALARPAPTEVSQEMLDSVASSYVTTIGQFKPVADMLAPYGLSLF